jgi:hypothetical protein
MSVVTRASASANVMNGVTCGVFPRSLKSMTLDLAFTVQYAILCRIQREFCIIESYLG